MEMFKLGSTSSMDVSELLTKVAVFVLVQALVYLILSKSSNLFSTSTSSGHTGSVSFRPLRSASIGQILAAISDLPAGAEGSSPSMGAKG